MTKWFKRKTVVDGVSALVLLLGTIVLFFAAFGGTGVYAPRAREEKKEAVVSGAVFISPLTGLSADEGSRNRRPFAVSIDNHPDSRSPSGLGEADIVWEVLVEGGITRFLAVFQSQDVQRIGPVRSARAYMIDWAREVDAMFAHVGGHHEALRRLANEDRDIANADAFQTGNTFWRDASRTPPHSTYTSTERLQKFIERRGWSASSTIAGWRFGEPEGERAQEITIDWSESLFAVGYSYDEDAGAYARELAGAPHRLDDGSELAPTNVVVMFVRVLGAPERGTGTLTIRTLGEGEAIVFSGGKVTEGKWKKPSPKGRTRFYKENGEEIPLRPGQTWIEVVPEELRDRVSWN